MTHIKFPTRLCCRPVAQPCISALQIFVTGQEASSASSRMFSNLDHHWKFQNDLVIDWSTDETTRPLQRLENGQLFDMPCFASDWLDVILDQIQINLGALVESSYCLFKRRCALFLPAVIVSLARGFASIRHFVFSAYTKPLMHL